MVYLNITCITTLKVKLTAACFLYSQDIQLTNIYISKEDNSLLDGSSDSPSPANSCHSSETEVQEEEVAEDDMTRQFLTAEERKG